MLNAEIIVIATIKVLHRLCFWVKILARAAAATIAHGHTLSAL